jgi:hypothetical protein
VWDDALCEYSTDGGEALALRWESAELKKLGTVLMSNIKSSIQSHAVTFAGTAVLGVAFAALAAPR